mmetsp:Transcript_619/g.886  ORF Transcript_619/g.886 Transcript_619/m.886 type:complete len:162 (-) Transcript_619:3874-4359(-)
MKYESQQFACYCWTQHCCLHDNGHGCFMCALAKTPQFGINENAYGQLVMCTCPICICTCRVSYRAEEVTTIAIAKHAKARQQVNNLMSEHQKLGQVLSKSIHSAVNVGASLAFCNKEVSSLLLFSIYIVIFSNFRFTLYILGWTTLWSTETAPSRNGSIDH